MKSSRNLPFLSLLLLAAFSLRDARAEDPWQREVIPLVWSSSLSGHQAQGNVSLDSAGSDVSDFGGSFRFTARRDPVSWFGEIEYTKFQSDNLGSLGNTAYTLTQVVGEFGYVHSFNPSIGVYAGLRYQDIESELHTGNQGGTSSAVWMDPIVGAQWTPLVSDHWRLWVRGDVGAGGSDLVWLGEAAVGYSWSKPYAVYLAYRVLDTDYESDKFTYEMQQSGIALGFGFRF